MGKRAILFGGAGFIGSTLAEHLLSLPEEYDEVRVVDNLSTGRLENLIGIKKDARLKIFQGDVRNADTVEASMAGMDEIYHLASVVGVRHALENPGLCIQTALVGTENVASVLKEHQKLLYTSSSSVYGRIVKNPVAEDDDLLIGPMSEPHWNYSWSKAAAELVLKRHVLAGKDIRIVRPFNVVGPRQSPAYGMVIPRFIQMAKKGLKLPVYGDGLQVRSFSYVGDTVRAFHRLMQEPKAKGLTVNVGSEMPISIMLLAHEVLKVVCPASDPQSLIEVVPYDRAFYPGFEETRERIPDTSLSRRLIGGYITVSLPTALSTIYTYDTNG